MNEYKINWINVLVASIWVILLSFTAVAWTLTYALCKFLVGVLT